MHPKEVPHSKTLGAWVASYVVWKCNEIALFVIVKEVVKLDTNKLQKQQNMALTFKGCQGWFHEGRIVQ